VIVLENRVSEIIKIEDDETGLVMMNESMLFLVENLEVAPRLMPPL
jgi:hypothetical protein